MNEEHVIYTKQFLTNILEIIKDDIHDLQMWSVYNEDRFGEEITKLNSALDTIVQSTKN